MIIEDVFSIPPDRRLSSKHTGHIMGRSNKIIGHLYLNPHLTCFGECYTGMLYDTISKYIPFGYTFLIIRFIFSNVAANTDSTRNNT